MNEGTVTVDRHSRTGPLVGAGRRPAGLVASLVIVTGAGLIVVSSVIHLHLWAAGYKNIRTIGPLFLVQGVFGIVLAVAVAVIRRVFIASTRGPLRGRNAGRPARLGALRTLRLPGDHDRSLGLDIARHRSCRRWSAPHRWCPRAPGRKG